MDHGRTGNLPGWEVPDGMHRAVAGRIEEASLRHVSRKREFSRHDPVAPIPIPLQRRTAASRDGFWTAQAALAVVLAWLGTGAQPTAGASALPRYLQEPDAW